MTYEAGHGAVQLQRHSKSLLTLKEGLRSDTAGKRGGNHSADVFNYVHYLGTA